MPLLPNQFEHHKNHNVFSNVSMEEFKTRSAPPQHGHLAVVFVVILIEHEIHLRNTGYLMNSCVTNPITAYQHFIK